MILDFLQISDLANLRFVRRQMRELASLNKNFSQYLIFLSKFFLLNSYTQHLIECFQPIFDKLSFYLDLSDKLYSQYRLSLLRESFQCEQILIHLFNCSRSETSFNACNMCSVLLIDSASDCFRSSINHCFRLMFSESVNKLFTSNKTTRSGSKIFYECKNAYEIRKSDSE